MNLAQAAGITAEPEFRNTQFFERGLVPAVNTPEQFAAFIAQDRPVAARVIQKSGLKPE